MSNKHRSRRCATHALRWLAFAPAQIALSFTLASAMIAQDARAQTAAPLSLDDALARALASDPSVQAASAGVDAARGGLRQARTRPNPELGAEVENFNGRGDLRGFTGAETTFSLSQEIELGGKRSARIRLADRELHGAELDRVVRGLDLLRDVETAYYDALAAEELASIERERLTTAEQVLASVRRRVAAARDPLMAGARAEAGVAEARIALTHAEAQALTARARLASFWAGQTDFSLSHDANALPQVPDHAHALALEQSPDIARLTAQRDRQSAAVALERSLGYQNPTLSFGYRRFQDRQGDGALVAGFSIPLGVFDRNQGAVERARAEHRRAELDVETGRRAIAREFDALSRAIESDAQAVRATEQDVIPQAERALALAQDGYNRGAFSYLDVLDAQRALSDARQRRIDALKSFHTNEAALDRLTARYAEVLPGQEMHQ